MKRERWDQMTPKARCYLLFKKIDANTRGVAKLGAAIWYLTDDELEAARKGPRVDVSEAAPDLLVALRTCMRERRILREALENELKAAQREAAAAKAMEAGRQ